MVICESIIERQKNYITIIIIIILIITLMMMMMMMMMMRQLFSYNNFLLVNTIIFCE